MDRSKDGEKHGRITWLQWIITFISRLDIIDLIFSFIFPWLCAYSALFCACFTCGFTNKLLHRWWPLTFQFSLYYTTSQFEEWSEFDQSEILEGSCPGNPTSWKLPSNSSTKLKTFQSFCATVICRILGCIHTSNAFLKSIENFLPSP